MGVNSNLVYIKVKQNFRHVLTGSYHNYFRIYDVETTSDIVLQADKSAFKAKKIGANGPGIKGNGPKPGSGKDTMDLEAIDFNKKILHGSWHPRENTIAVGPYTFRNLMYLLTRPVEITDSCHQQFILGMSDITSRVPSSTLIMFRRIAV